MILKKRFQNKQLAINRHIDINLNIDLVSSIFDVKSLRSLYDTVESDIRAPKSRKACRRWETCTTLRISNSAKTGLRIKIAFRCRRRLMSLLQRSQREPEMHKEYDRCSHHGSAELRSCRHCLQRLRCW